MLGEILASEPRLRTTGRMVRLSTDSLPTVGDDGGTLLVGTELTIEDTGTEYHWTGTAWARTTYAQKLVQLVELQLEIRDLLRQD